MTKTGGRDNRGARPGNQLGVRHGGAGAVARIHDGKEFIGLAREAELSVQEALATGGRLALLERNACRLQAAADLYHGALLGAAEAGDLEQFVRHLKTWGWLVGAAIRAWLAVGEEQRRGGSDNALDYEQMLLEGRRMNDGDE